MSAENQGNPPERRSDAETRVNIEQLTTYLTEIASKLDQRIFRDLEKGVTTSQETETLKTQIGMIQNRLIHCCEGKLRRERPNAIFHEVAEQMENIQTRQILLSKVKKGIHDERE